MIEAMSPRSAAGRPTADRPAHGAALLIPFIIAHLSGPPLPAEQRKVLRARLEGLTEDGSEIGGGRRWHKSRLPGISLRLLRREAGVRLALWRLAPGAVIPGHPHRLDEECLILAGELRQGERRFRAGDFILARAGTRQKAVSAPRGALLLIRGEDDPHLLMDERGGGRLPEDLQGIAERRSEALIALFERWCDRLHGIFALFDADRAPALCLELFESLWLQPPEPAEVAADEHAGTVIFRRAAALLADRAFPGPPDPAAALAASADDSLKARLSHLSAIQREVLARAVIGRKSSRAIALELGLPEGTVKSHLHRAARRLSAARPRRRSARPDPKIEASRPSSRESE